ncbi:MAG: AI-2E family transporter [Nitrospirae bacterium]|nr:AI-2E family transporter [Nitrospirota bacterium]MBF0540054.1 AI-2E family transporter [Nitrospirota bacterium]
MYSQRFYLLTIFSLLALLGYLTFEVFSPFFSSIMWAIVLGIVFYPFYSYLHRLIKSESLASILTILVIILLIFAPLSYLSVLLGKEIAVVVNYLQTRGPELMKSILSVKLFRWILTQMNIDINFKDFSLSPKLLDNISNAGSSVMSNVTTGLKSLIGAIINFVFAIVSLYFFFIQGAHFITKIRDGLPFSEWHKDLLAGKIKDMVISTIYGGVVVSILQGCIGAITLYFLGVDAPVLWGMSMSIMSFVPMIGTFAVWGPISVYLLFIKHDIIRGAILIAVSIIIISSVDNILKPKIISGRTNMPMVFVFFSVLGGMKFFGLIGMIMGPLVLVLFLSLFEIFRNIETDGIDRNY